MIFEPRLRHRASTTRPTPKPSRSPNSSETIPVNRGEIWQTSFDPTVGDEIRKTRPALIISSDAVGVLDLRVVVPLTEWGDGFAVRPWMIRIDPTTENG